jgi:putative hydrolase of the HAD superfamily
MSWVLFDYGGVISEPQPAADVARMAEAAGATVAEFSAAYWAHRHSYDLAELDADTYWGKVGSSVSQSYTCAQVAALSTLDVQSWLHLREPVLALIDQVARAGHQLALLSNAPVDMAEAIGGLPLASQFRHLVFSCALRAAKPDPACYSATLDRLGAAPADVVFVDDRADNVAAAAAVGIRAVRFTGAGQARADLARLGAG